jgi:hypothetical protein
MMEPLFANNSSLWSPVPSQGFGWYPTPLAAGNRSAIPEISAPVLVAAVAARRGQPQGPGNDQEIEEFIYDTFELVAGSADIDVRCDAGRVTLTGVVPHKRLKHDLGEIAWAIPAVSDVQNNMTITARRRTRAATASREGDGQSVAAGRKQS